MSKGQTYGDSSLSRRRRERATKSNRRSGILLASLVALAVAGAAWYWTQVAEPARDKEAYKEETSRLFAVMKSKSNRLSKNSSEEVLNAFEIEIRELAERDGVKTERVDPLIENVEALKRIKSERRQKYEAMGEAIKAFPLDSSPEKIKAFDAQISGTVSRLERSQGAKLHSDWLERRKVVASELKTQYVGELMVRSDPSKADVYLDGKLLSKTPFKASGVRTGRREVVLRKMGYRDKSISVSIEDSGGNDLGTVVLDPIVGGVRIIVSGGKSRDKIEIEIEEADESVSVGGLEVVQGYQHFEGREHQLDALRIGNYVLIVLVNGRIANETSFVVSEGEIQQVPVEI